MYASDIRPVTDAIIAKYGLNGPRKSYYCEKAPALSHGYHQVCVDDEQADWFYCTCTCHRGRIVVRTSEEI